MKKRRQVKPAVDNDGEVLACLWEAWKISLQESQGWTSMDQWVASEQITRDPLPPHRITILNLDACGLTSIPPEIGQLTSLRELGLSDNQLTSLPPEIGLLSSLQWLNLDANWLASLPPEIGLLSSLKWLYLIRNSLTSLPPEIGLLSSLQGLYLIRNSLTSLPPEIGLLSSLQGLYLTRNSLTSLPPEIGQLSSLRQLRLNHNQLTGIPPEIGQLSSLQWLYLDSNALTSLPPEIGQLSSLIQLRLGHNQLTSLPPEMGHLSSLHRLSLNHNQLASLPLEVAYLSSLLWLVLNDNCLVYLPSMPLNAKIYGDRKDQRLPTVLDTTTFHFLKGSSDASVDMDMVADDTPSEFSLYFYSDESPHQQPLLSSPIPIADRHSLARRWPYFRHLLDAGLSEAHSGNADLSAYFSLRLGQCLVDTFEERPIQVSSLSTQDCRDLVAHADYFGLTDTLLFHFCTAKLRKMKRAM
ncbi:MAG: leucine-rich repeat domain-containing protein [Candidatus Paceibacterota bacterium]|jgi:hypothetical protein